MSKQKTNTGADLESSSNHLDPLRPYSSAQDKLVEIVQRLDRLGILDLALGVLEDDKQVGSILGTLASDDVLTLATKYRPLVRLASSVDTEVLAKLVSLFTPDRIRTLSTLLDFAVALDEKGLIEPLAGFMRDETAFSKLASVLAGDTALSVIRTAEALAPIIGSVNASALEALVKALNSSANFPQAVARLSEVVSALDKAGLLDPVVGLLQDEKVMGEIVKRLSDDRFLELARHSNNLFALLLNLADMDEELLSLITAMQTDTFKKVFKAFREAGTKQPRPVKGTLSLLRELGNEDVGMGLGVVFSILREIGRQYAASSGSGTQLAT